MYYIGQTRNFRKRDWEHKKGRISNHSWFDNCYHKHPDQFTHRFLKIIEAPSKELLVKQLNELEIYYIAEYRKSGKKLYNNLSGGNAGWKDVPPTQNMLDALNQGRKEWNDFQHSQTSKEQQLLQHRKACKRYTQNNPEKNINKPIQDKIKNELLKSMNGISKIENVFLLSYIAKLKRL